MPAFMAGLGMRQGMPRRQFNQQAPGGNQFTNALNQAGDATATAAGKEAAAANNAAGGTPTGAGQNYNPYAAAASGGANPWTYNAQTGGYQPNSNAWMPDWMRKPEPAAGPVMKKERQLADYTPYADDMQGTKQQALDLLAAEAKKRGVTPNWNDLQNKFGSRVQNGMVSGSLYNDIMKEAFGKDVDVEDKEATAAQKAEADKRKAAMAGPAAPMAPSNPWMTPGGGYGGYMPTQTYGQAGANTWQTTPGVSTPWGTGGSGVYTGAMPNQQNVSGDASMMRDRLGMPIGRADDVLTQLNPNDPRTAEKRAEYNTRMTQMQDLLKQMGQFNLSGMGG